MILFLRNYLKKDIAYYGDLFGYNNLFFNL